MSELGKIFVVLGLSLALVGALLWAGFGQSIGKLPGDLNVTRGNVSFHFPVVTCLLLSALFSLVLWLFRR